MHDLVKVLMLSAAALAIMQPVELRAQQQGQPVAGPALDSLTLVYEREVYTYSGENRRDPFRPLTAQDAMGPRFEALTLQGIIYSTGRGRSIALLNDSDGRVYRVRVGDMVGNSRVIEIGPVRVVLAVENFGTIRQEILELPTKEGTDR